MSLLPSPPSPAPLLSPDTPGTWLIARFAARPALISLLGGPRFCQPGEAPSEWARFIVIKPPLAPDAFIYAGRWPQLGESRVLAWAELRTDKLAPGLSPSDVLAPLLEEMMRALLEDSAPEAPTGGKVHGAHILGFYTPPPAALSQIARVAQKGLVLHLTFS